MSLPWKYCITLAVGLAIACLPNVMVAGEAQPVASSDTVKQITAEELERGIGRGLDFLYRTQNKDGSWGSARKTKDLNIYAPVPGAHDAFRCAVTAMCIQALLEAGNDGDSRRATALGKAEPWLLKNLPQLRRAEPMAIYNVWGHAYGIAGLVAMYHHAATNSPVREQIKGVIAGQMDLLRRYESVDGGWGYLDFQVGAQRPATSSISFVSATVLVAFHEARKIGVDAPEPVVKRAIASILRQRKNDYSYLYGEYLKMNPMMPVNRPAASLGRSQACSLALRYWGDTNITQTVLTNWLDRLIVRNEWLSFGRKRPIPHESYFQVAGYFYYYGHYYAALCVEELSPELARPYRKALAGLLLPLQEKDGSWWDYPLYDYHQPYGTAFALMTLQRCR